ncbi:MAG: hypothetical protein PHC45_05885 [Clostridiaceae bacterium]|nr:hypothetical protein [Clostridiaceae bacterium]
MNNAAIVVFKRSTLPKILKFFVKPLVNQIINTNNEGDIVKVYVIECPVMKYAPDNIRVGKSLYSLCMENNISFFIGKNIEYYLESGLEHIENRIGRGDLDEIRGIKSLAALIKLSLERNSNLLNKNMCFIGKSYGYGHISAMLEEASGVFIYEHDEMNNNIKKTIFEKLMLDRGISAVFTKDLDRAITQCEIIVTDGSVNLEEYKGKLSGKILIGKSTISGDFFIIESVLLWYERLEGFSRDNGIICLNDELLGILKHFYREKNTIDFIRRFPYIMLHKG